MQAPERFGPLKERPFRLLWLGRTGSSIGDALISVALAFAVLRIGGGSSGLGIVLASFTIGRAGFAVAGGVWADRLPRRAVMIGADLVRVGTQATTAALLIGGAAHVWELAVLQARRGSGLGPDPRGRRGRRAARQPRRLPNPAATPGRRSVRNLGSCVGAGVRARAAAFRRGGHGPQARSPSPA